ncbi:PDZ domain-containing protein [Haloferula rosea]|uniref:Right-handed parallel beta-helix repeat-containing protein n=1 Tax=Haloferula rosea TaxID=490093 RepID=A0A934RA01_9BACT|nr:PDZ domain-containing protein [Haloferula rosea]MBK1825534.1 right-handed parallel beta-helix repeat-containing protein [Haloferula rosea]
MKTPTRPLSCILFGTLLSVVHAADIYVSPDGADTASGSKDQPLASLASAQQRARTFAGKEAVTVHLADGIYYLPETLVFTPEDSGSAEHPVIYKSVNEGGAVLSGGSQLELSWEPHQGGVFKAATPDGLVIDQVFIDGKNQRMARYPNYDPAKKAEPYQGYAADAFSKERAATWADPTGGYIHSLHKARWGGYHYRITGKNAKGEVTYEGGWQNNRQMGMHKDYRMVENIFEELDAEGEWFHDAKTNTLYYMPVAGTDLNAAKVEVVRLRHLIEFKGSEAQPVKHITLQGFVVRHAARTFMDCKEPLLRSDWAIYRGGAYFLTGTEDIRILDTEFDQVGGNAVFVNNYNRKVLVKGCHIHDAGASGVCFVGDPDAVRDPLFEYQETNDLSKIDRTVGPKTNNYPSESAVEDCLIHGIGRVERQPAGVQISMAQGITVRDTSIYDTARAGINISEGTWGGHLIERCDVFDTVLETHDHGSFNSWGRDRFWHKDRGYSQKEIDKDPELPFLDAMKTTVIRDSRWRCDHGWDIDLDDGSSNYDIYNNLMLNNGLKLREGFRRRAWNNITVNNGLHPHVWYESSKDEVFSNIFMSPHKPARMSTPYTKDGTMVDRNLYAADESSVMKISNKLGWDKNSVFGDPMFVDPANCDFQVKEGSPAFEIGFKNFPMDQFGVKKASLKAIARTPVIPEIGGQSTKPTRRSEPRTARWMGAELGELSGVEFSAYGVSKEDGGVALTKVPADSAAAKEGLKSGDLIQGVNGKAVKNIAQLLRALSAEKSKTLELKVVRDQKATELTVTRKSIVEIESASTEDGFKRLPLPAESKLSISAAPKTNNESLSTLTDGKLAENFGPVFGNGVHNGAYKVDLGAVKPVTAITSWSFRMGNNRGPQKLTIYGSNSEADPGFKLENFTPLGSIDTGASKAKFTAASLQALDGESLGDFRWIVWAVSPVSSNGGGENTAFQELAVETKP